VTTPAATGDAGAFYLPEGDRFVPTILTQGPWSPDAQHGGPVAALLAHAAEQVPSLVPMRVARLTIDLLRSVPLRPLRPVARIAREGKRIQIVDVSLLDETEEVARCSALRVRIGDTGDPEVRDHPRRPDTSPPEGPGRGRPLHPGAGDSPIGFIRAIDAERVVGDVGMGAPAVMWIRLRVPLVAGHATSPMARLALAADFSSALAAYLDTRRFSFINADINLHVLRLPAGEWIAVDGVTWVGAEGIGQGSAKLYDLEGLVGTASAAQLVDRWQPPDWMLRRGRTDVE
jgi:hypothetical protein